MTTSDEVTSADPVARAQAQRRVLIGVQTAFWGGYLVVMLLLAVAMLKHGGLTFWPYAKGDMVDPKDVIGLGIVGYLLHVPLTLLVVFGGAGSAIAGLAGMGILAFSPTHRSRWLYISTALTLACTVVQLTPFGARTITWMLD